MYCYTIKNNQANQSGHSSRCVLVQVYYVMQKKYIFTEMNGIVNQQNNQWKAYPQIALGNFHPYVLNRIYMKTQIKSIQVVAGLISGSKRKRDK